jgi:hypothetical protein
VLVAVDPLDLVDAERALRRGVRDAVDPQLQHRLAGGSASDIPTSCSVAIPLAQEGPAAAAF